jgi:4-hydroxythreonine-4-phosphate dehydrogenase
MTRLLVPTGDPAGVGPEIALRAAAPRACSARITLYGDGVRLRAELAQWAPRLALVEARDVAARTGLSIVDTGHVPDEVVHTRAPSPEGGRAQLASLDAAIDEALAGGGAVVTGPTSKAAIELSGVAFTGQTEHLARRAGLAPDAVTMMFLGPRLKTALVTTHLALSRVSGGFTEAHVSRTIDHLRAALVRLEPACEPRIGVSGLNPHAGEGGLFGREEIERISPAVERARSRGLLVEGVLGAETAFRLAASGAIDGVVAMFHDQATIASKLLDWGAAVNVTWGLPFVRTSVDHGVAYDAAAAGRAECGGMEAAMDLALRLADDSRRNRD